jgi:pimeloyl-ACP methyl ester carboxylesterase
VTDRESRPQPYDIDGVRRNDVDLGGITLSVYEAGDRSAPTVMFSHGFPELAYSWRHQLRALADAGFHAVAPDLTGDLASLLDVFDTERAVFVGHDWGGFVVWQMPFLQRARVAGIVGVNTPQRVRRALLHRVVPEGGGARTLVAGPRRRRVGSHVPPGRRTHVVTTARGHLDRHPRRGDPALARR